MTNRVILVGVIASNVEVRRFPSGGGVANLSIATSEHWQDKAGLKKEFTTYHRVAVYQENMLDQLSHATKGTSVVIEGKLETRKFTDKSGVERYVTEVTVRPFKGEIGFVEQQGGQQSTQPHPSATRPDESHDLGLGDRIPF